MTNEQNYTIEVLEYDRTPAGAACPNCKEDDIDRLIWRKNGEELRCSRCGFIYQP